MPGRLHVDQDEADAVLLALGLAGAHQREHAVGVMRMRGPDLGAVDDVVVAVAHRARLQRGEVGARARLGIALAPIVLAGENPRQIEILLLRRAEADDDGADHLDAHDVDVGHAGAGAFGLEDPALRRRPVRAAMFHRPARRAPALLVQRALPGHADIGIGKHRRRQRGRALHFRREICGDEVAHFLLEGALFGAEAEIHGALSFRPCVRPPSAAWRR